MRAKTTMRALAAATAVLGASAVPAHAADRCGGDGTTTVRENRLVRVYHQVVPGNGADRTYFTCAKATGRRLKLGVDSATQAVDVVRVKLAVTGFSIDMAGVMDYVGVVDNAARWRRAKLLPVEGEAGDLVVSGAGPMAWTVDNTANPDHISQTLWVRGTDGRRVMYDYGEYLDGEAGPITDLRFRGSELHWANAGRDRSRATALALASAAAGCSWQQARISARRNVSCRTAQRVVANYYGGGPAVPGFKCDATAESGYTAGACRRKGTNQRFRFGPR